MADSWLLTVLKERQQRGLGWNEASDGPQLAADLAAWVRQQMTQASTVA